MTAVVTFVSSVRAATTGTTCKEKVETQMLSGPHFPGPIVAYKCGAFSKKEEASKTYSAFRTVWSNHSLIKIDLIHLLIPINLPTYLSIDLYIFKFIYVFIRSLNHSFMSLVIYPWSWIALMQRSGVLRFEQLRTAPDKKSKFNN